MTHAEALRKIPYLRNLPTREHEDLSRLCEFRTLTRGAVAFSEGDEPEGVFLILRGRIRLVRSSKEGREQVIHEEGPGATLAEVPVFDGAGYVASAVAVEDSVLFFVPRGPLLRILDQVPGSALEVIRILAARMRKLAAVIEDLSLRDVLERTAGYLLRQAGTGDGVELPATREELAAHLGTVREQVSRALSQLKASGTIAVEGRLVRIIDRTRLEAFAASKARARS
jgi:CRP-like cAMP-binding protein